VSFYDFSYLRSTLTLHHTKRKVRPVYTILIIIVQPTPFRSNYHRHLASSQNTHEEEYLPGSCPAYTKNIATENDTSANKSKEYEATEPLSSSLSENLTTPQESEIKTCATPEYSTACNTHIDQKLDVCTAQVIETKHTLSVHLPQQQKKFLRNLVIGKNQTLYQTTIKLPMYSLVTPCQTTIQR